MHEQNEFVVNDNISIGENQSEDNSRQSQNSESPMLDIVGATDSSQKEITALIAREYDANLPQMVFVDVDDEGQNFQVEHYFSASQDEHFFQFDEKRQTLLKTNEHNKKIRLKNKAAEAYLWFWNLFCTSVVGYGDPEEAQPENWRSLVLEEDKIAAVQGLFSAQIIPQKKTDKKFLGWNRRQGADYKLEVLFDGDITEVAHRLKAKDAQIVSDWTDLSGAVEFESGRLLENKQEMSIPASAREKVPFFDKLIESSIGYRGRVPAFIKLLVVNDYFAATGQTGKKHKTSSTP